MRRLKVHAVIAAAVATFSTAGFGLGAASAQDSQLLCPEGQIQVSTYVCDPVTGRCVLVDRRCE